MPVHYWSSPPRSLLLDAASIPPARSMSGPTERWCNKCEQGIGVRSRSFAPAARRPLTPIVGEHDKPLSAKRAFNFLLLTGGSGGLRANPGHITCGKCDVPRMGVNAQTDACIPVGGPTSVVPASCGTCAAMERSSLVAPSVGPARLVTVTSSFGEPALRALVPLSAGRIYPQAPGRGPHGDQYGLSRTVVRCRLRPETGRPCELSLRRPGCSRDSRQRIGVSSRSTLRCTTVTLLRSCSEQLVVRSADRPLLAFEAEPFAR